MAQNALSFVLPAAPRPRLAGRGFWAALGRRGWALIRLWRQRARTRRALAGLDDRLLRDVGLDSITARREAALPFWRASTRERR